MEDNMVGKQYGRLVVIRQEADYITPSGGKHKRYVCMCDCGNEVTVMKEHLTSGRQKSCGCLKKENGMRTHGEIHTRLYRIWGNMCNRCTNKNNPVWDRYGGRGIHVCDEWKNYECFRNWAIENGYNESLTIDRINNDSDYCPENCRWVNDFVQANNKRNNHIVTYKNKSMTIAEWARVLQIPYKTLHRRLVSLKWDVDRAFTTPVRGS